MRKCSFQHVKTLSFYSKQIPDDQFDYLLKYAKNIIHCKNELSKEFFDVYKNKKISKFDYYKHVNRHKRIKFSLPSSVFQEICFCVYENYKKKKPPKRVVRFSSLTVELCYSTCKSPMFELSSYNDKIGIMHINIQKGRTLHIPFSYNKDYHGDLSKLHYSMNDNRYQKKCLMSLDVDKKRIRVMSFEEDCDYKSGSINNEKILGVDTNTSKNLFMCSDGHFIDYDRKLMNKILKHRQDNERIFETKKKRGICTDLSKRQIRIIKKDNERCKHHIISKIIELIFYAKNKNYTHIVVEDLEITMYQNTLMKMLHFLDIKNIIKRLGKKYDLTISVVPAAYTSRMCSKCGFVDKNNRKQQEHFKCIQCGFEMNADLNAAINIKNRVSNEKIKNKLTVSYDNGYISKDLSLGDIKKICGS